MNGRSGSDFFPITWKYNILHYLELENGSSFLDSLWKVVEKVTCLCVNICTCVHRDVILYLEIEIDIDK